MCVQWCLNDVLIYEEKERQSENYYRAKRKAGFIHIMQIVSEELNETVSRLMIR
jgi:hypothetical protein